MNELNNRSQALLRRALTANAGFSALSAIVFIAAAGPVAEMVGARPRDIAVTGVSLVLFAAMIVLVLTRFNFEKRWIRYLSWTIAGLDVLWVVTTPLNVIAYTPAGKMLFAAIGLVVGLFAVVQIKGLLGAARSRRGREALKGA